ncbi:MAG: hypothetical protein IPG52_10875 [Rhodocyclaceae bacterium]|nr:hypothetical protein [Rhodocyclaceae bacterium]
MSRSPREDMRGARAALIQTESLRVGVQSKLVLTDDFGAVAGGPVQPSADAQFEAFRQQRPVVVQEHAGLAYGRSCSAHRDLRFVGIDIVAGTAMAQSPDQIVLADGATPLVVDIDDEVIFLGEVVNLQPGAPDRCLDRGLDTGGGQPTVAADQVLVIKYLIGSR